MRTTLTAICLALSLVLMGFECIPGDSVSISITDEEVSMSVVEMEGGITIENLSDVDCTVYVRSPEGEQMFELGAGESITVTGITAPIEVGAVAGGER